MSEKSSGILADTSVWIEFFKQRSATGDTLEALILEDSIWVCGGVLFELVQGVKSDNERLQIQTTLSHLKYARCPNPCGKRPATCLRLSGRRA